MAKKDGALLVLVAGAIGLGIWAVSKDAKADDVLGPSWDVPGSGGGRGKGPGGSPKAIGDLPPWGDPAPGASYLVPDDWDPMRGLWISPDCVMVIEGPGWYCGSSGSGESETPNLLDGFLCNSEEGLSLREVMAIPGNGAAGYIAALIGAGHQPGEIAYAILEEASPMCAAVNASQWGPGLQAWYDALLQRVIDAWEDEQGIDFDPEAAQGSGEA